MLKPKYHVMTAADGQEALDRIRGGHVPDVIVSDVMMPRLDGYGLVQRLRSQPQTQHVPVILLSARAGEEARVRGLQAGATDYLAKPFSGKVHRSTVNAKLDKSLILLCFVGWVGQELVARVDNQVQLGRQRVHLEQQVQQRTQELVDSEDQYRKLAQLCPVGIMRVALQVLGLRVACWKEAQLFSIDSAPHVDRWQRICDDLLQPALARHPGHRHQ